MTETYREITSYALSDGDLRTILGSDIPVIPYPELKNIRDIDEVFDKKGRCMVLFLNASPTSGHWCCLIRRKDYIEFFDPYGESPQNVVADVPRSRLEMLDMDRPYLTALLRQKKMPVYYNSHPFQKESPNVATCGRHCAIRLLYAPYDLHRYKAIIDKSKMTPDMFVSAVTFDKLGK